MDATWQEILSVVISGVVAGLVNSWASRHGPQAPHPDDPYEHRYYDRVDDP